MLGKQLLCHYYVNISISLSWSLRILLRTLWDCLFFSPCNLLCIKLEKDDCLRELAVRSYCCKELVQSWILISWLHKLPSVELLTMKNIQYQEDYHNELWSTLLVRCVLLYMVYELWCLFPTMYYRQEIKNIGNTECSLQSGTIFTSEQTERVMLPWRIYLSALKVNSTVFVRQAT